MECKGLGSEKNYSTICKDHRKIVTKMLKGFKCVVEAIIRVHILGSQK